MDVWMHSQTWFARAARPQYLVNPSGRKAIPNALAVGVNVVVNF